MSNLCRDCRHHRRTPIEKTSGETYFADHCLVFNGQDNPVTGEEILYIECGALRLGPCGMDGKFFERRQ